MEVDTIAASARSAVNDQLDYLNMETKILIDKLHTSLSAGAEKHLEAINQATAKALEKGPVSAPYRDVVLRNHQIPTGVDPRVLAL